jgi:hypothetical protein
MLDNMLITCSCLILDITTCKDQRQAIQIIDNIKIPQSVSYFEYSIKILPFCSIATLRTFSLNSAKAVRYGITVSSNCEVYQNYAYKMLAEYDNTKASYQLKGIDHPLPSK